MADSHEGRQYPQRPVLGVGALIWNEGQILLVQRGKQPLQGFWSLPGGGVETGERLEAAVEREVLEETGLHVSADSIATVFERIMPDDTGACEYHYVLIDFYCSMRGGTMQAGSDSISVRWFEPAELGGLTLTDGTRKVIDDCVRLGPALAHVTRP